MAYAPNIINFPTLSAECNDTEARSLKKINDLTAQMVTALDFLAQPGAGQASKTTYVYGIAYTLPAGANLLDLSCYNPADLDCWACVMITPGPPSAGMQPAFPTRVYAHNNAYYEAMTSGSLSVPTGNTFSIAVSSTENVLTWNPTPIYLAIRHS